VIIQVECQAGATGDEEPLNFQLGERKIEVKEVLDRWLAPDHRYFKLRTDEGVYILRHEVQSDVWQLTLYTRL
jgi:hypothetical protein